MKTTSPILFGTAIKHFLTTKGLAQHELADRTQITQAQISAIERNKHFPKRESLIRICNAMNISTSQLIIQCLLYENVPEGRQKIMKQIKILIEKLNE